MKRSACTVRSWRWGRIRADLSQLSDRLWNTYELSYAGAEEALREYDARKAGESAPDGEPLSGAL